MHNLLRNEVGTKNLGLISLLNTFEVCRLIEIASHVEVPEKLLGCLQGSLREDLLPIFPNFEVLVVVVDFKVDIDCTRNPEQQEGEEGEQYGVEDAEIMNFAIFLKFFGDHRIFLFKLLVLLGLFLGLYPLDHAIGVKRNVVDQPLRR